MTHENEALAIIAMNLPESKGKTFLLNDLLTPVGKFYCSYGNHVDESDNRAKAMKSICVECHRYFDAKYRAERNAKKLGHSPRVKKETIDYSRTYIISELKKASESNQPGRIGFLSKKLKPFGEFYCSHHKRIESLEIKAERSASLCVEAKAIKSEEHRKAQNSRNRISDIKDVISLVEKRGHTRGARYKKIISDHNMAFCKQCKKVRSACEYSTDSETCNLCVEAKKAEKQEKTAQRDAFIPVTTARQRMLQSRRF